MSERLKVEPIQKIDVHTTVVERIRRLIRENRLEPGDQLPAERELGEMLGVGRSTVREALKSLLSTGVIEIRHGVGTFVRKPCLSVVVESSLMDLLGDKGVLYHLLDVRRGLVLAAIEDAVRNATAEDLEELNELLQEEGELGNNSLKTKTADTTMETMIVRLAKNPVLFELQTIVNEMWIQAREVHKVEPKFREVFDEEHQDILRAMAERDVARAVDGIRRHLDPKRIELVLVSDARR